MPLPVVAELWRERTPPDFTFDVKAHALLTGQPSETKRLPKDIRTALPDELIAKPRLYARDLPAELANEIWRLFREGLEPLRAARQLGAVLLQHPRWVFPSSKNRDAILEAKERLSGLAVSVEFRHGSWFNEKNAERTREFLSDHQIPLVVVLYDQGELREWVPRIRELAAQARETHVPMNNCYANHGSTNAREIAALLLDLEASQA